MSATIKPIFPEPIKLKISLENMPHSVFRRILIPDHLNMLQLHDVIQVAMGWENAHLFQFSDKKLKPTIEVTLDKDEEDEEDSFFSLFPSGASRKIASETSLKEEFFEARAAAPFFYWYDFGDDWWHKLTFQKTIKKDLSLYKGEPMCIEAIGACPPEDVGGPWGYTHFLEAVSNRKHPEFKNFREWLGMSLHERYDSDKVDVKRINAELSEIYRSEREDGNKDHEK